MGEISSEAIRPLGAWFTPKLCSSFSKSFFVLRSFSRTKSCVASRQLRSVLDWNLSSCKHVCGAKSPEVSVCCNPEAADTQFQQYLVSQSTWLKKSMHYHTKTLPIKTYTPKHNKFSTATIPFIALPPCTSQSPISEDNNISQHKSSHTHGTVPEAPLMASILFNADSSATNSVAFAKNITRRPLWSLNKTPRLKSWGSA